MSQSPIPTTRPIPQSPTPTKRRARSEYELTDHKYLEVEEQARFLETLKKFEFTSPRDTTLLWLALATGARASELLNIKSSDVFGGRVKKVFIRGLKSSRDRAMPIPDWLYRKVLGLIPCSLSGRVFPISYIRFYQIWCDYRPVKKKLHSLRHTYAVNVYRGTRSLFILQTGLGHRSLSNTLIYARYEAAQEDLNAAMRALKLR